MQSQHNHFTKCFLWRFNVLTLLFHMEIHFPSSVHLSRLHVSRVFHVTVVRCNKNGRLSKGICRLYYVAIKEVLSPKRSSTHSKFYTLNIWNFVKYSEKYLENLDFYNGYSSTWVECCHLHSCKPLSYQHTCYEVIMYKDSVHTYVVNMILVLITLGLFYFSQQHHTKTKWLVRFRLSCLFWLLTI